MGTPARPEPAAATADRDQPAASSPAHGGSLRRRVLAWLLPPLAALLGCLFAALATLWLARLFRRQIGGYTGDCLGATQQLSEVAFYCGLLCNFS